MFINIKHLIIGLVFVSLSDAIQADSCRPAPKPDIKNFFYHLPTIETDRLILRPIQLEDAEDLFEVHSDLEAMKYLPFPVDQTVEATQKRIARYIERGTKGESTFWAVIYKDSGKVIGRCGFWEINCGDAWGEIIRLIHKDYWGKGIGTEILYALCHYGFLTVGLNRIYTITYVENIGSLRTYEKIGFRKVGLLKEIFYYKGAYWDRLAYEMLASDFNQKYETQPLYTVMVRE